MSLSLVAPLALGLLALVALPIIAHIARQKPKERVAFGAMLLLERVQKRLRRRRRIKDPLLLLLRLLMVALVALAISGLQWSYQGGTPQFGGTGRVVILIDQSMSMSLADGGRTLLEVAKSEADQVLEAIPDGTLVGAIVFGDEAELLSEGLVRDSSRIRSRIAALGPTLGKSNLRSGLLEARRMLEGEPGEIYLFSDEAGPTMVPEASEELRRIVSGGSAVIPRQIRANPPRNIAVADASFGTGVEGGTIDVRVSNYGPEPLEVPCEVTFPDGQSIPFFADLPPEGEIVERLTVPRAADGGVGKAHCEDVDLAADNERFFHLPRVGASSVLVVDGDPGDTPIRSEVYFLERALAPWGDRRGAVRPEVVGAAGLLSLNPERHQVVFLANVSDPRPYIPAITEFVRQGGALVVSMGTNVDPERYNTSMSHLLPASIRRVEDLAARGEMGVPLEVPGTDIELFEPFTRSGRSAFQEVRSRRLAMLQPYQDSAEVSTLLRYSGGAPALVQRTVGQGTVLLWTSSVDYDWSSLPTQAVFMPLVQRVVGYLGADSGGSAGTFDGVVGRSIAIPLPDLTVQPSVTGPDGNAVPTRLEGSTLVFTPDRPGAYSVSVEALPTIAWVAANLDASESDVRNYDDVARSEAEIKPDLFTRVVDLSPYLWAGALLLMFGMVLLGLPVLSSRSEEEAA